MKFKDVPLAPNQLQVDPKVQRPFKPVLVAEIVKNFNPGFVKQIVVSLRQDGRYYVLDGQHTVAALKELGLGDVPVLCRVYSALSTQDEAGLFLGLNGANGGQSKRMDAITKFLRRVTAGDPIAVGVLRQLQEFGLRVAYATANEGTVSAVVALEAVYLGALKTNKRLEDPFLLKGTLFVLHEAWGMQRAAYDGVLLKSVGYLIKLHRTRIDVQRLSRTLQKHGTPGSVIGEIKAWRQFVKSDELTAGAAVLRGIYNKRIPDGKKLPE